MTEIIHGNKLTKNRKEHMEINLSKQKKENWISHLSNKCDPSDKP